MGQNGINISESVVFYFYLESNSYAFDVTET